MNLKIDTASVEQTLKTKLEEGLKGKLFSVQTNVKLSALFVKTVNADIAVYDRIPISFSRAYHDLGSFCVAGSSGGDLLQG